MTRTVTRLLITVAFGVVTASAANAQAGPGSAAPLPGTGDSAKISSGNQQNNSDYNHLIAGGNDKPKKEDRPVVHQPAGPATAADIKAGAPLRDIKGVKIGTIASVDGSQAVVDTGQTKIGVPLVAFGKDDQGLLLGMTADKFNALVAQAHAKSQGSN